MHKAPPVCVRHPSGVFVVAAIISQGFAAAPARLRCTRGYPPPPPAGLEVYKLQGFAEDETVAGLDEADPHQSHRPRPQCASSGPESESAAWSFDVFCFIFVGYWRRDGWCIAPGGGDGPVAQGAALGQRSHAKPWDHFASDTKNPGGVAETHQRNFMPQSYTCLLYHLVFSTKDR